MLALPLILQYYTPHTRIFGDFYTASQPSKDKSVFASFRSLLGCFDKTHFYRHSRDTIKRSTDFTTSLIHRYGFPFLFRIVLFVKLTIIFLKNLIFSLPLHRFVERLPFLTFWYSSLNGHYQLVGTILIAMQLLMLSVILMSQTPFHKLPPKTLFKLFSVLGKPNLEIGFY